ncbi:hypothetical protein BDV32DRAFT_60961 [Aspergillus pseudonomiae]|nr:hypothetical protein BDV32DRAFT_60961 [Aspergillus pseudonomiae]
MLHRMVSSQLYLLMDICSNSMLVQETNHFKILLYLMVYGISLCRYLSLCLVPIKRGIF